MTFITSAAQAAEQRPFAAPQVAEQATTSSAGGLMQVTLSLLLVLAAVFAAAWVVRRLRTFGRPGAGSIKIVADVALGTKERAVVIQVGNQQLLIGVAPGRVNTLHTWPAGELLSTQQEPSDAPLTTQNGQPAAQRPDFKAILKRSLGL